MELSNDSFQPSVYSSLRKTAELLVWMLNCIVSCFEQRMGSARTALT